MLVWRKIYLKTCACFDPCSWIIHIQGSEGTLYEGEEFVLQFKFNSKYPFDSPQVSYFREHGGVFFKDAVNKQWAKKILWGLYSGCYANHQTPLHFNIIVSYHDDIVIVRYTVMRGRNRFVVPPLPRLFDITIKEWNRTSWQSIRPSS